MAKQLKRYKTNKVRRNLYQQARRWQKKVNATMEAGVGNITSVESEFFEFSKHTLGAKEMSQMTTAQIRKTIKSLKYRASGEVVRITVNNAVKEYLDILDNINPHASKAVQELFKGKSLRWKLRYMSKNRNVLTSIWNSDQILEYIRKNEMFDEVSALEAGRSIA